MARPYSLDLRERVVAALADGATCREVAALFDVAVSSVVKWSSRKRSTGSAAAIAMGGRRFHKLEAERLARSQSDRTGLSKLKTLFRKARARSIDAMADAVRASLPRFMPDECRNYFSRSGYASI